MKTPDGKDTNVLSKTPDEIKKANECCASATGDCNKCPYNGMIQFECIKGKCLDTLSHIEQLEARIPKWISVEERLPDMCGMRCLLCGVNQFGQRRVFEGFTGYMERGSLEWHSNNMEVDIAVWKVTHWMPLPEMPKEE